ncbi:hypothetical protein FOA52_004309 [Chlamydomonas sp. UWO 241]|nr:hypothetical protein FOA52_004309 [Chlamydomonas sp. UWO 241]
MMSDVMTSPDNDAAVPHMEPVFNAGIEIESKMAVSLDLSFFGLSNDEEPAAASTATRPCLDLSSDLSSLYSSHFYSSHLYSSKEAEQVELWGVSALSASVRPAHLSSLSCCRSTVLTYEAYTSGHVILYPKSEKYPEEEELVLGWQSEWGVRQAVAVHVKMEGAPCSKAASVQKRKSAAMLAAVLKIESYNINRSAAVSTEPVSSLGAASLPQASTKEDQPQEKCTGAGDKAEKKRPVHVLLRAADVLATLVEEHRNRLDHIHAATALHHAARLSVRSSVQPKVISQLVQVARQHLQQMRPQQLSNTAWALAKLGHVDAVFMGALVQVASTQLRSFNPQNLANTAWALALMGHVDAVFIGALLQAASSQLRSFNSQELANTAWALATMGHVDAGFLGALLQAASSQLRNFTPQALANTAWALAKLGHVDAVFMGALLQAASSQLRNFNSQDLANTAWALAMMGHVDAVFIGALLQAASSQLRNFNSQDLANTAWALATLGHMDAVFMDALIQAATSQLRSFKSQDLANTAWALAKLGHADTVFISALVQSATLRLHSFKTQELVNTAWALATIGHADAVFMGALVQAASSQLHNFNPQALANTAWALATMGHVDAVFMGALVQAALSQLRNFTPQELANTAWALAALDNEQHAGFMGALIEQACTMEFTPLDLCQLFHVMLWLDTWQQVSPAVPLQLFAACKRAWLEVGNTNMSRTQLQVLGAIRQLPGCSGASSEQQTDDNIQHVTAPPSPCPPTFCDTHGPACRCLPAVAPHPGGACLAVCRLT